MSYTVRTKVEAAWRLLADIVYRDEIYTIVPAPEDRTRETLNQYYRDAARRAHPDAGGSDEQMAAVNRARDLILADLG